MSSRPTAGGFEIAREQTLDPTARVTLDGHSPTEIYHDLTTHADIQDALVTAIREFLDGATPAQARTALRDAGVTALDGLYADLCVGVARGQQDALARLLRVTPTLGSGQTPLDLRSPADDRLAAVPPLFAAVDRTPTIEVVITEGFRDRKARQRRAILEFLTALARGCTVRVVAGPITRRFLRTKHADELPAAFTEQCDPRQNAPDVDATVTRAFDELDPDGREVWILELLADQDNGTLHYSELAAEAAVSESRLSQCRSTLQNLALVDVVGTRGNKRLELRPAGRQFLDRLNSEIGRQRRLDDEFSDPGQQVPHRRVTQREHGEGGEATAQDSTADRDRAADRDGDCDDDRHRYRVRYLARHEHDAAAASAPEGGIAAVEHPISPRENSGDAWVSYRADREELVVSTELASPIQYAVCLARSLTDGRVRSTALTESDVDELLAESDRGLLRDARQLGWLPDDVESGEEYWNELTDARETLLDLTWDLHHEDDDDERDRLCGEILRLAHGLAGVVTHALDRVGVEVVREVRCPRYTREDTATKWKLARTVAKSLQIQSTYGDFAAYRQLLETRERKRETAMEPRVDAADPMGELIGRMTLVGGGVATLADQIADVLEGADPHDDAPEFAVSYPFDIEPGWRATADAVRRLCDKKRLRSTREAVSVFEAVTGSAYATARALHALAPADYKREIRLDEVRYALASLPSECILPDAAPSVRKIVAALLETDGPLSGSTLSDAAGVSSRSVRRHTETLAALDLVRETEAGYRVALPRDASEAIAPKAVRDRLTTATDSVATIARAVVDDDQALRAACQQLDPGERLSALAALEGMSLWADVGMALAAATIEAAPPPRNTETAIVGPTPKQMSLRDRESFAD